MSWYKRPFVLYALFLTGSLLICLLSWLPNPRISLYGHWPSRLGQWVDADANVNTRTAVPFVGLGLLAGAWLAITRHHWRWWGFTGAGFLGIVALAELGQSFLPNRHPDWGDVVWGGVGAFVGMLLGAGIGCILGIGYKLIQKPFS
jgi:hypothetical protein